MNLSCRRAIIIVIVDCEKKMETLKGKVALLNEEEKAILARQVVLKKELYAKFGDSINLES